MKNSNNRSKSNTKNQTNKKPDQKRNQRKIQNSRRQKYLAAILFVLMLVALFGGDIRQIGNSQASGRLPQKISRFADKCMDFLDWLDTDAEGEKTQNSTNGKLQVHFLDIGQGDATLLVCDGHAMLVDAGNNNQGTVVQSYLQSQGIEKLDYMIGTHPDADHIGGLDVILTKFPVGKFFMPDFEKDTKTYEEVIQAAAYRHLNITYPEAGKSYPLGEATFTILGPVKKYSDANNSSICFLLEHGENRFLFTGDAEEEAEQDIAAVYDVSADVYKAAHHGSRTATSKDFFQHVRPIYAVISCGDDNSYHHPHAEVLNRLRMAGVQMFRTDDQGTIVVTSDGTDLTFNCAPSENWASGE